MFLQSKGSKSYVPFNILYVICIWFVCHSHVIQISILCTRMSLACHSNVTRKCLYFICMYSFVIGMSFVCTRMSSLCYTYALICCPHFTCMYSYIIHMSLVWLVCHPYVTFMYSYVTCMSLICTRLSSVCHSYLLGSHPYVTCKRCYMSLLSWVIFSNVFSQEKTKKNYVFKWNILKTKHNRKKPYIAFSLHHWLSICNKNFWDLMISAWIRAR